MILEESFGILIIILCVGVAISFLCCIVKFYAYCYGGQPINKSDVDLESQRNNVVYYQAHSPAHQYLERHQNFAPVIWTSGPVEPYINGRYFANISGRPVLQHQVVPIDNRQPLCHFQAQNIGVLRRARSEYFLDGNPGLLTNVDSQTLAQNPVPNVTDFQTDFEHLPPPSYEEVIRKISHYPLARSMSETALYRGL